MTEPKQLSHSYIWKSNGVKVTASENRFEVVIDLETDAKEQELMNRLRDWVRARRAFAGLRSGE